MDEELVEMHAIARGRVQGVGCRATVRYHATQLEVVGTVCNLPDGTVEIYAQAPKKVLERLLQQVKEDLGDGCVASITTNFYPLKHQYESFSIVYAPRSIRSN